MVRRRQRARAATVALGLALVALAGAAPAAAETIALVGGKVVTLGAAGTLETATVLIADGKIVAVGPGLAVPAGARVIDVAGKVVTPGLFDSVSQIGLVDVSLESSSRDTASSDPRITAAFDVADAFNPRSVLVASTASKG